MKKAVLLWVLGALASQPVLAAGVCDYRLSNLMGSYGAGVTTGGAAATAVAGTTMKAAGLYSLTHATTGAAMLGSTAAGASAAGTVGIMAGSAGILGTVGAVLMSPFVIIPAAVTAVGVAVHEGSCYLLEGEEKK